MSSLALPPPAQAQAPLDPRAHWITPEEQLNRLDLPIELTRIEEEITRLFPLIPVLANLVAHYLGLDESVTNWHTALKRLNSLPEKIPPLPVNIYQILDDECPIYVGQLKADKTAYKIRDTHFLSLVPEEFGNLNRFEEDILKPYGKRKYSREVHPFRISAFFHKARAIHADVPFPGTHWILMTKDILPGSRNKTWDQQVELVNALSLKATVNYEIPTLQQIFVGMTTDMAAIGERRYETGGAQNGNIDNYTRVIEKSHRSYHLAVGGFDFSGVYFLDFLGDSAQANSGVAVLRKF